MKTFGNLKKYLNYAQEKTEITDKIRKSYGLAVSFENIPIAQQVKWLNAFEISLKELNIQKEHDYFEDIKEMNEYFEKHNYPLAVGYSPVHVKHAVGRNKDGSLRYLEGEKDDLEMF